MTKQKRKQNIIKITRFLNAPDDKIKMKAMDIIKRLPSLEFINPLYRLTKTENGQVRKKAITTLNKLNELLFLKGFDKLTDKSLQLISKLLLKFDGKIVDKITENFETKPANEKIRSINMLRVLNSSEKALMKLYDLLNSNDEKIRATAVKSLGIIKKGIVIDRITKMLDDKDDRVVANAIEALELTGDYSHANLILSYIDHKNNRIRANALKAYFRLTKEDIKEPLTEMIKSYYPKMRASAAWLIGELRYQSYSFLLDDIAFDGYESVKQNYLKAIEKLKENFDYSYESDEKIEPSIALKKFISNSEIYKIKKSKTILKLKRFCKRHRGICRTTLAFILLIFVVLLLYQTI